MSNLGPIAMQGCPRCNAENRPGVAACWLCGARLGQTLDTATLPPIPTAGPEYEYVDVELVPASASTTFTLTTAFLGLTLVSLIMAAFAIAPGLGILLAIATAPAFIRTLLVSMVRERRGMSVSPGRKALLFLGSMITAVVMVVVTLVAAIGSLCAICFAAVATQNPKPVATVIGLGALLVVGFLFSLVIWTRWQHDTTSH